MGWKSVSLFFHSIDWEGTHAFDLGSVAFFKGRILDYRSRVHPASLVMAARAIRECLENELRLALV